MTVIFNSTNQRFRGYIERAKHKADKRVARPFKFRKRVRDREAYEAAIEKNKELLGPDLYVKEHRVRRYALKPRSKVTITLPKLKFLDKEGWDG